MTMLTLYQPPSTDGDIPEKTVVPPGVPYITKVNGKLVMARAKREKPFKVIDLLGQAFGVENIKEIKKRSQSISAPPQPHPLLIGGVTYVAQNLQAPNSTPIQQGPFPQVSAMMPPYGYQNPQLTYSAPFNAPAPTLQQFDDLRSIDAHYNKYVVHQHPRLSFAESNERSNERSTITKTTVAVTKHICANCGRLRSRRYHKDHPITPGEMPTPGFCGKCQLDVTETDTEMETETKCKNWKLRSKQKRREKATKKSMKHGSSSSDQDSSRAGRRRKSEKEKAHFAPSQDIVTVVEQSSDEEVERGRRGTAHRNPTYDEAYGAAIGSHIRLRPSSTARRIKRKEPKFNRELSQTPERPVSASYRIVEVPRVFSREKFPSPVRRQVEASAREQNPWDRRSVRDKDWTLDRESAKNIKHTKGRIVPIQFANDEPEEPAHTPTRSSDSTCEGHSQQAPSRQAEEPLPPFRWRTPTTHGQEFFEFAGRENSSEGVDSSSSQFSKARHQHRRERRSPVSQTPWISLHAFRPKNGKRVTGAIKKSASRSKREVEEIRRQQEELEEGIRQQENADKAVLGDRYDVRDFTVHGDNERYYKDNWVRNYSQAPPTRVKLPRRRYRRGEYEDSSLAESEVTYGAHSTILPRAPSPPSPPQSYHGNWPAGNWNREVIYPDDSPYPPSSESESTYRHVNKHDSTHADSDYYKREKEIMPSTRQYPDPYSTNILRPRTDSMRSRAEELVYGNQEPRVRSDSHSATVTSEPGEILYESQDHRINSGDPHLRRPEQVIRETQEQRGRGISRFSTRTGRERDINERQEQAEYLPSEPLSRILPEIAERTEVQVKWPPESVCEVTTAGTDKALVISPNRERLYEDRDVDFDGDRHVRFQEPVLNREASNNWTPTEISDNAACMTGWGGTQISAASAGAGGGTGWMSGAGQPEPGFGGHDWGAQSENLVSEGGW